MSTLKQNKHRNVGHKTHWAWLLPILALAPLSLAAKGCNSGVVGDDCPTAADCMNGTAGSSAGTAGSSSQAGTGNTGGGKACAGLLGTACDKAEFCNFAPDAMCGAADQTGTCQALPQACDLVYSPVCGCDDKTYGNECEANSAGVSAASKGECGTPPTGATCGGLNPSACAAGEYCIYAPDAQCGAADQTGKCTPTPQVCNEIYAPVCGCDDKTYGNDCEAARAGVSVVSQGECGSAPTGVCGARSGDTCDDDQYCYYTPEALCGRADATGTCVDIPRNHVCLTVEDPVCGCDGKTYSNDCYAGLAGMSVDHEGACETSVEVCGGFLGVQCDEGQFCDYPPEPACGEGDFTGECKPRPMMCTAQVDCVVGCDGKPYSNSCEANAAGTDVSAKGACPK